MTQNEETKPELVIVSDDWERFLSTLEKFMSIHQKTVQKVKDLNHRNEALRQELRDAINLPRAKAETETSAAQSSTISNAPIVSQVFVEPRTNQPRTKFLQPVKRKFKALGSLSRALNLQSLRTQTYNSANSLASCEKCGHQILRASRFCEGCGGDFGAMMCPCGRQLNPGDKFCDNCGRTV